MLARLTSISLLVLTTALMATGTAILIAPLPRIVMDAHRVSGWMLVAILPFKAVVVARSIGRGIRASLSANVILALSIILAAITSLVIALAMLWLAGVESISAIPGWRMIHLHWLVGLGVPIPLAVHVWKRWLPSRSDELQSRRAALGGLGVVAGGAAMYFIFNRRGDTLIGIPESRPVTGSREQASHRGNALPVTTNAGSGVAHLDPESWDLSFRGRVGDLFRLSLADLLSLPPHELTATLDCTVGWYSEQVWTGVPLSDLIGLARPLEGLRHVRLIGASGYRKDLPLGEAWQVLLATHVGGEPLSHSHGAPLRAVVPTRRGWFWVKWLVAVELRQDPIT